MFDVTKEVPSLELCEKLKELGYPQNDGGWYWIKFSDKWILGLRTFVSVKSYGNLWTFWIPQQVSVEDILDIRCQEKEFHIFRWESDIDSYIKAPTVREMMEWLYDTGICRYFKWKCECDKNSEYDGAYYNYESGSYMFPPYTDNKNFNNIFAELLIWLKENGYIDFK